MTTDRRFRYYRTDFGKLPVRVIHMDLVFDVFDDHTLVTSEMHIETGKEPVSDIALDARNLEDVTVQCPDRELSYEYDTRGNKLRIHFLHPVPARTAVVLHTRNACRPTHTVLEGLYYDVTPPGAPPQQITQCQQWGFQRLVPCFDDMTAKCTYITTIIADSRYTHLISNGDIGVPRHTAVEGRDSITYHNTVTPMAPYLFFLGCGTWDVCSKEFEYPDGDTVTLEILVPPGSDPAIAEQAVDILADAVLWVYLFTGPGRYDQVELRHRAYTLADRVYHYRKTNPSHPDLPRIRSELTEIVRTLVPGYKYTGKIYREIAMQNSDFGGMENVGNTTVTANRIIPFSTMTDASFEYLARVKLHEFYHNLNGSEVTGESPFEIWLNEAVTVHIEEQYHSFHFGEDYSRLQAVLGLLAPANGTLDLDRGTASMPIEPDGFNDPNELITDITYRKAPEVVRMIETLIGKKTFVDGLDRYHRRYRHGNATRADWVRAMEEASGTTLGPMAGGWLTQTGFPTLSVETSYNADALELSIRLRQASSPPGKQWIFPVRLARFDSRERDITEELVRVESEKKDVVLDAPETTSFLSLNRGFSFYGEVRRDVSSRECFLQAGRDTDIVSRYLAFTTLADREKLRLLLDPAATPDPEWVDLYFRLLTDTRLMQNAGGQFLTVFESSPDSRFNHRYQALYDARERLLGAVASRYKHEILDLYESIEIPEERQSTLKSEAAAIRRRQVRNTALSVLSRLNSPDIFDLEKTQLQTSPHATDRWVAFALYMDSAAPDRMDVMDTFGRESGRSPVTWENFLAVIAGNSSPEVTGLVTRVEGTPAFHIELANDQRALYGRFAQNRKKSLLTRDGREFLSRSLSRLARVNEYSTISILRVFGALDQLDPADQVPLVGILAHLLDTTDPDKTPSVYNTARRILLDSPVAVAQFEQKEGPLRAVH